MGTQLLKLKPLDESLRSKKSRKCLKTILNISLANKCDMHKKANLKESIKSSTFCSAKTSSMSLSMGNPNLKDVRFIMHKVSLMMLELMQEGQKP
jgi:hypothetical protein